MLASLEQGGKLLDTRNREIIPEILPSIIAGITSALCITLIWLLLGAIVITLIIAAELGLATYIAIIMISSNGKFLEDVKEGMRILRRVRRKDQETD